MYMQSGKVIEEDLDYEEIVDAMPQALTGERHKDPSVYSSSFLIISCLSKYIQHFLYII